MALPASAAPTLAKPLLARHRRLPVAAGAAARPSRPRARRWSPSGLKRQLAAAGAHNGFYRASIRAQRRAPAAQHRRLPHRARGGARWRRWRASCSARPGSSSRWSATSTRCSPTRSSWCEAADAAGAGRLRGVSLLHRRPGHLPAPARRRLPHPDALGRADRLRPGPAQPLRAAHAARAPAGRAAGRRRRHRRAVACGAGDGAGLRRGAAELRRGAGARPGARWRARSGSAIEAGRLAWRGRHDGAAGHGGGEHAGDRAALRPDDARCAAHRLERRRLRQRRRGRPAGRPARLRCLRRARLHAWSRRSPRRTRVAVHAGRGGVAGAAGCATGRAGRATCRRAPSRPACSAAPANVRVLARWVDRLREAAPRGAGGRPGAGAPSTGAALPTRTLLQAYRDELLPRATVVTPNRAEAACCSGMQRRCERAGVEQAAHARCAQWAASAVAITGGDADGDCSERLTRARRTRSGWLACRASPRATTTARAASSPSSAAAALALRLRRRRCRWCWRRWPPRRRCATASAAGAGAGPVRPRARLCAACREPAASSACRASDRVRAFRAAGRPGAGPVRDRRQRGLGAPGARMPACARCSCASRTRAIRALRAGDARQRRRGPRRRRASCSSTTTGGWPSSTAPTACTWDRKTCATADLARALRDAGLRWA